MEDSKPTSTQTPTSESRPLISNSSSDDSFIMDPDPDLYDIDADKSNVLTQENFTAAWLSRYKYTFKEEFMKEVWKTLAAKYGEKISRVSFFIQF